MKISFTAAIALVLALCTLGTASEGTFAPYFADWNAGAESPVSMAFLLPAPAGKAGFIRAAGGHLVDGSGARFRIWGVNITARATLPSKETAPLLAAHLARHGINCVRLHFLDKLAPNGLIDANRDDTQRLDAAQLDTLDFFIAKLKDRGIYTDLNLNVGRTYKPGDGVPDCELLGFAKAITYFNPRLIELQKQYARQLLTHRNAYTGQEYRHEPAVALVELVNENSLVESWFSDRLLGQCTCKFPGTWTDIPERYEKELSELFNRWLRQRLSPAQLAELRRRAGVEGDGPIPRLRAKEFAKADKERFETEATFYMDLERRYFDDMAGYLRDELGVKPLLLGTSDHNHGKSGYPLICSTSRLDVVDGHVYWQHPHYVTEANTGKRIGFTIPNTPMVNDPLRSTVAQLSRTAVAGKPYTVSEVNHPFPHEFACEGIPILTAYALLHDWDGLFWYTLAHEPLVGQSARGLSYFDLGPDPMKMTQIAAGALIFLRGDVQPAKKTVQRSYGREQVIASLRLPWSESPFFTPGFPAATPLVHATRIASLDGPPTAAFDPVDAGGTITSDTGQLKWSGAAAKQGVVTVQSERSQAIVGFCKASRKTTDHLAVDVDPPFCAITLSALDPRPIAQAERMLLTATARVENSDMQWNDKRTTLEKWGGPPVRIEPVVGSVVLKSLQGATAMSVQPLDANGAALGLALQAEKVANGWKLPLGNPPTTWYLVTVVRSR